MSFDPFAALTQGDSVTIHNAKLRDVQPLDDGFELLEMEYAGTTSKLMSGREYGESSRREVGMYGYIQPAQLPGTDHPTGSCRFISYIDQSLRRVPELDSHSPADIGGGRANEVIGWRCDARPSGFRAPVGIIPGEGGRYVPDETIAIKLRVPPEFVRECKRVQMAPEELLRSFVGDVAGIDNYVRCPRADGYGSNGSDERDYANAWLERAHGLQAIDLDVLEYRDQEAEERQFLSGDFLALLDDYERNGGMADDLLTAVQNLVDKQIGADKGR